MARLKSIARVKLVGIVAKHRGEPSCEHCCGEARGKARGLLRTVKGVVARVAGAKGPALALDGRECVKMKFAAPWRQSGLSAMPLATRFGPRDRGEIIKVARSPSKVARLSTAFSLNNIVSPWRLRTAHYTRLPFTP